MMMIEEEEEVVGVREGVEGGGAGDEFFSSKRSTKSGSKYDYVKVRVWLSSESGQQQQPSGSGRDLAASPPASPPRHQPTDQHYYVLSRFLLARMLTAARVPKKKATQVMLELKKKLVDENRLDVSQRQLEAELFRLLRAKGYTDDFLDRFVTVRSFAQRRIPLVVLLCGASFVGKATIGCRLAEVMNLSSVLQTDHILAIIKRSDNLWQRGFDDDKDRGAPPSPGDTAKGHGAGAGGESSAANNAGAAERLRKKADILADFRRECCVVRKAVEGDLRKAIEDGKSMVIAGTYLDPVLFHSPGGGGSDIDGDDNDDKDDDGDGGGGRNGDGHGDRGRRQPSPIVPIVLWMDEEDHLDHTGMETDGGFEPEGKEAQAKLEREVVQKYYLEYAKNNDPRVKVCQVKPMQLAATVDNLHQHILECIKSAM